MISLDIGSCLLSKPNNTGIEKHIRYLRWQIPFDKLDENEKLYLTKETVLSPYQLVIVWLDVFSCLFPDYVTEDAKRVAYDLVENNMISKIPGKPNNYSFYAVISLYLSCRFHGFDFEGTADKLNIVRGQGRKEFGLKRKNYKTGGRHYTLLRKYSKIISKEFPQVIGDLERMYKKLEGLYGEEMDLLQGDEQTS